MILAALVLSFTVPARNALPSRGVVCRPVEAIIYRHRQAPAWVAMHPAMQLDGDVWAATWPSVRTGAAPVVYARIPLDPNTDAGKRVTYSVPVDSTTEWFYFVVVRDEAGKVSAQSNEVGR